RPHPTAAGAGEPHPPHLRVRGLQQTVAQLRRRPHHRLRPGWTHLLLQPRTVVPSPPPPQDPRWVDLPAHRSTDLPLDQPVGARVRQRPHPPTTYL
ncbi:Oligophrenin-1, partial [Nocardioides sp. PD653-B2]